jgi:hypothetical protein
MATTSTSGLTKAALKTCTQANKAHREQLGCKIPGHRHHLKTRANAAQFEQECAAREPAPLQYA